MISNIASSSILSALTGKSQYATLAPVAYLALSSTEPTKAGGNVTEPSGNGYARVMLGNYNYSYTQHMGAPAEGLMTNVTEIHFNEATGDWGTQQYACIFDALTGGRLLAWGALKAAIAPAVNTVAVIKAGELTISIE